MATKSTATSIKNLIASHLRGGLFGMAIYGRHEIPMHDGTQDRICVIEVSGKTRFERYGRVAVYHPLYGKWIATLLSEHHTGKPIQVLTLEQITAEMMRVRTEDFVYKVYGVTPPDAAPVIWDAYWEGTPDA